MALTSSVEPAAMRPLFRRCVALAPLLLLVLLVSDQNMSARTRMPVDMPPLVLWAWDRDDDLGFIDIRDTAVAYLAATVILRGETVFLAPRHHPLGPPKGTRLVAVAHVEVDRHEPPVVSDAQARDFAATLAALRENLWEFLQIDFEAKSSQRDFFVKAVAALRQRLPNAVLSATALTSWCLNERWTQSLAVDEVVPMLFRLGPDRRRIREYFADGGDFRSPNCRTSIGIATDVLPAAIPSGRRIYAFSPRRWNAETYATLRERIRQWSDASRLYCPSPSCFGVSSPLRGRPVHSGRRSGSSAAPARIRWTISRISAGSSASCVPPSPTTGFTPPIGSCWAGASRRRRPGSCSRAVAVPRRPSPTR